MNKSKIGMDYIIYHQPITMVDLYVLMAAMITKTEPITTGVERKKNIKHSIRKLTYLGLLEYGHIKHGNVTILRETAHGYEHILKMLKIIPTVSHMG
jgi:hypothetical protein